MRRTVIHDVDANVGAGRNFIRLTRITGVGLRGLLAFGKAFRFVERGDQALDRRTFGRTQADGAAVAFDLILGHVLESEAFGQVHGLTTAIEEKFGVGMTLPSRGYIPKHPSRLFALRLSQCGP